MAELVVRCPSCESLARVPGTALGQGAVCPACGVTFPVEVAIAAIGRVRSGEPPTVYPVGHDPHATPPAGLLYGLALSAFLLPLVWLLLRFFGVGAPVFTLGLPLGIALGTAGLGVGVALADKLRYGTRVKSLLGLLAFAWLCGGVGFVTKTEWVEAIRRKFGMGAAGPWHPVSPPKHPYTVEMPGPPREDVIELVDGWRFNGFRFGQRKDVSYCIAHGKSDVKSEDQFFKDAAAGALAQCNGTLQAERKLTQKGKNGREYVIRHADQATLRVMRVYYLSGNNGKVAVVAAVEGAFLPPDAPEVKKFFNSLTLKPGA